MNRACAIAMLLLAAPSALHAQAGSLEREVRAFLVEYDKAVAARNIAFLERVMPDDYVFTGASGRKSDRAQVLKYFTQQRAKPSYRMVSLKHENVVVRAVGNMAVVTNDYTSRTTPVDMPTAEPDSTSGRHTGVFEKRNGQWMVIAEQDTEQIHDDKLMVRQVTKAGRDYNDLVKRLNAAGIVSGAASADEFTALTRMLSDEYIGTSADGVVTNKTQEVDRFRSARIRLERSELSDHRVSAIDNSAALETGTVRVVGTDGGKPIDISTRYTRTWVSWGDGWQIIAQHSSQVKP